MVNKIEFSDGETVLTEGAPSDFVYRILIGAVEIFSEQQGESILLGVAREGEFLGEMGIIERRPRSASARARGKVVIEKMERWEFVQLISDSPISANRLIERLSERLRQANQNFAKLAMETASTGEHESRQGEPKNTSMATVKLFATTERLAANFPDGGVEVTEFPFIVGREMRSDEPLFGSRVNLQVADAIPYRLSPSHFSIVRKDDGFTVRDLGSAQGTCVNGVFIGDQFERDSCKLGKGENTVVAGGIYSLFGFNILVEDAA